MKGISKPQNMQHTVWTVYMFRAIAQEGMGKKLKVVCTHIQNSLTELKNEEVPERVQTNSKFLVSITVQMTNALIHNQLVLCT